MNPARSDRGPEAPRRLRWALRGVSLAYAAPDFPGRDALIVGLKRYARRFDATVRGRFWEGLRFEGNPGRDANMLGLVLLGHTRPHLAPLFEAALPPGGVFADVGANLGLYTLWAARRAGPDGAVHAFEPVPATRARLLRNLELNGFRNVTLLSGAVGATAGRITLHTVPAISGLSSRYAHPEGIPVDAEVTTLDAYFAGRRTPDLVKIDVEGMELEVLRGARGLLRGASPPVVVFEADSRHFSAAGTSYAAVRRLLAEAGYRVFALREGRLHAEPADVAEPGSPDVVALRPDLPAHARVLEALGP